MVYGRLQQFVLHKVTEINTLHLNFRVSIYY
jgi:hypothetical protein